MIQDEYEPVIDFSWFYFIGKTRLNMSFKETGRLTLTMFNKLYGHYKNTWDMEMRMTNANKTYADVIAQSLKDEEWF